MPNTSDDDYQKLLTYYQENITGPRFMSSLESNRLRSLVDEYGEEELREAIYTAVANTTQTSDKRNLAYITSVLAGRAREGMKRVVERVFAKTEREEVRQYDPARMDEVLRQQAEAGNEFARQVLSERGK